MLLALRLDEILSAQFSALANCYQLLYVFNFLRFKLPKVNKALYDLIKKSVQRFKT